MTGYRKHQNDIDLDHTKFSFHNAYHKTVVIPNYMMNAMRDLVKKRGFARILSCWIDLLVYQMELVNLIQYSTQEPSKPY